MRVKRQGALGNSGLEHQMLLKQKVVRRICQPKARQYFIVDLITGFTGELLNETPSLPWVGTFQVAKLLRVKGFFLGSNLIAHPGAQLSPSTIPIRIERTPPFEDELLNARCHPGSIGGMDFHRL